MPLLRPNEFVFSIEHRHDKGDRIEVTFRFATKLQRLRIHMSRNRQCLRLIRLLSDATGQINRQLRDIDLRQNLLLNLIVLRTLRRIVTTARRRSPYRLVALRRKISVASLNAETLASTSERNLQRVITTIRLQ